MFDAEWFWGLEKTLRAQGLDSDDQSFDEIREMLAAPKRLPPESFADACAYVILAGGFSQKTAKKIHTVICEALRAGADADALFQIFHNKNKINAIVKIWQNRNALTDEYYAQKTLDDKLAFIQKLPHIGKITANHLARNLGENVVKYDIWIQRLGVVFAQQKQSSKCKVHPAAQRAKGRRQSSVVADNQKLNPQIKKYCDDMFAYLEQETNLPIGYIDVVLWKSAQNHLIEGL